MDSEARKESRAIRKRTRLIVGTLIVALGLGIGWLGGKALNRSLSHAPAATDLPANENAPAQQPQSGTQSPSKDNTQGSQPPAQKSDQPSAPGSQPQSEAQPPAKPETTERPKPPDMPDPEEASKEVGRKALKKMMKEINNANGNSNSAKKAKNTNANENRE